MMLSHEDRERIVISNNSFKAWGEIPGWYSAVKGAEGIPLYRGSFV